MNTTTARSWAIGVTAVIATAAGLHLSEGRAESHSIDLPHRTVWMRTHCPVEDALDCAWNAHQQGNGEGTSFYAVKVPLLGINGRRLGVVACHYLVPTAKADRFDNCQILHRKGGE